MKCYTDILLAGIYPENIMSNWMTGRCSLNLVGDRSGWTNETANYIHCRTSTTTVGSSEDF